MMWTVEKREDGKWQIRNTQTGEVKGPYNSPADAEAGKKAAAIPASKGFT